MSEIPVRNTVETAYGWVAAAATEAGLLAVTLPQPSEAAALAILRDLAGESGIDTAGRLDSALDGLRRYYAGEEVVLDDPLDMHRGTAFQRKVWQATREVTRGVTTTYGELAIAVGSTPAAARAVGRCMALNPWPPLVPCHRVLGKDGSLTGFGGGIPTKRRMLEMEGALLPLG